MSGTSSPAVSRLYLDTNIFIYAIETSGELGAAIVRLLAHWPPHDPPFLCTSELSLAELVVKPLAEQDERLIGVYDGWTLSSQSMEVAPVSRSVLWTAANLRSQFPALKLPDAVHLATALRCGCSHILTNDSRILDSYTVHKLRFGAHFGSTSIKMIRPTTDAIESLISGIAS